MPIVNMTQAAKLAGVGRTTLYRKASKGVLSTTTLPDGSPGVDTAEIFRVFPSAQPLKQNETIEVVHDGTRDIALLELEITNLRELLAAERRNSEDLRSAIRLLEHQTTSEVKKRRWWSFF